MLNQDDPMYDVIQRLSRLEVKVDALLDREKRWFDAGVRTWVALIGSIGSVLYVILK